jgi:CBS domain-containing protein
MSQVRDIVDDRKLFWVEENDTVADVARRMAELQVGAILVLNAGELRGIFSERDLMRRVVLERLDLDRTPVRSVMSTQLATIDESASIEDAMEAMQSHKCRHLPRGPGDGVAFHARPHKLRVGAEDRGTAPHARLHPKLLTDKGLVKREEQTPSASPHFASCQIFASKA